MSRLKAMELGKYPDNDYIDIGYVFDVVNNSQLYLMQCEYHTVLLSNCRILYSGKEIMMVSMIVIVMIKT